MAAIESAEEAAQPKPRRSRKAKVAVSPVEEPVIAAEPVAKAEAKVKAPVAVEPVAEEVVAPAEAEVEVDAAEEAKPARANRQSNVTSSEPVVTSVKASTDGNDDPTKPKKGGRSAASSEKRTAIAEIKRAAFDAALFVCGPR